jgi:hypothetical protein
MIRRAIDKTGRPMVLSLSPGPTQLSHAAEVAELANMWRISDDIWDVWPTTAKHFPQSVTSQFARLAAWSKYAGPGHWPDADMLPFGELKPAPGWGEARSSRLSLEEERTQLTLWAMGRSPLIVGANLTMLDEPLREMLTNRELVRVDQRAVSSREVFREGDLVGWSAELPNGVKAVAVFNLGEGANEVKKELAAFGFGDRRWAVRDVWAGRELGQRQGLDVKLPAHGCALFSLR